ncbi:MAG: hypothetical protein LBE84_10370 [Planctomycetota bacterium]|jgi:hypothetical protein|nr:hypothetical protein [Planctomycetota bacterium]
MAHQRPIVLAPQILPAKSPELNPAGQAWREIRQTCPGNRVFSAVEELDGAVADAGMQRIKNKSATQSLCAYGWIMNIVQNQRKMVQGRWKCSFTPRLFSGGRFQLPSRNGKSGMEILQD